MNSTEKQKPEQKPRRLHTIIIATIVLSAMLIALSVIVGGSVLSKVRRVGSLIPQHSLAAESRSTQQMFDDLMTKIAPTNVCPGITPVIIYREVNGNKYLHATGGILSDNTILTCGHAFWDIPHDRKLPLKYYYQVLQPFEKKFRSINRLMIIDNVSADGVNASKDVIRCIPGESQIIAPIPALAEATGGIDLKFDYFTPYTQKKAARSTITGESTDVIGFTKVTGGLHYFVLDSDSFPGQSGTIFAGDDNATLYIISRSIKLNDELRKVFRLSPSKKRVVLCSSVKMQ